MKRVIAMIALCTSLLLAATGCAGGTGVPGSAEVQSPSPTAASAGGNAEPLVTPEPATAPSGDRADFASLIREFSDDGDEATDQDLWDLGVTICELFGSSGGFDDVLTLTDEQAFSPDFAIAVSIASTTYICPEHDARIGEEINEYLA